MTEECVFGRSLRAATSTAKDLPAEVFPNTPDSYPCEGTSKSNKPDKDDSSQEGLRELIHEETLHVGGRETKLCYWCHGYCDFVKKEIAVRPDVSPAQAIKTLVHELGHALLHGDDVGRKS